MSFKIEDDIAYLPYIETWNKTKRASSIRFHSQCIYDGKYMKTKVKTFDGVYNTVYKAKKKKEEKSPYIRIAAVCLDFILKIDKEY